jgi:hypothetical protein
MIEWWQRFDLNAKLRKGIRKARQAESFAFLREYHCDLCVGTLS